MRPSSEKRPGAAEGTSGGAASPGNYVAGGKFKGVRMRKWGKWVAEVRLPNSRERIWLGSYDTPEKAARAYDAAVYCLRGPGAAFNFPDDPPHIPDTENLTPPQIQAAAARFAHAVPTAAGEAVCQGGEPPTSQNITEETARWPGDISGRGASEMEFLVPECGASPLGCYFTGTEEEEEEYSSDGGALYQQSGLWSF
ncbi:hypothetical protein H6P81_015015 [Aristolochia fimbriata]|uniref:AP2/ERF domain-containing protein n=1 Tax=Aristolochia fimbriata TaxID=158543 RepID=A0AAV7E416_ARIFI|nr:hypothetical protein H6P81_015015 [Aristolochia fimbriata]